METGTFTANSANVALILENENLLVDRIYFQVIHATTTSSGASHGKYDGTSFSRSELAYTSTATYETTSYAITHYKRVNNVNTKKLAGTVTDLSEAGMVYMHFDNYDSSLTIRYFAYEA